MLKEIIIAVQSYFKAHRFIRRHRLWKWIIIPGIVYTVLFVLSMIFFGRTANHLIEFISIKSGFKAWMDKNGTGLLRFLVTFAGIILWLVTMLFYFSLFKYVWLIVGSPVFAYLSEKTDAIIAGKPFEFNSKQYTKDILHGIRIAVRNSLWQSVYMISILLLSLIPVAGWLTPLLALLVECYYYGFSMLYYSFERRNFTSAESIYFIGHHRGLAIGNGIVFYVMQLFPVVGWVLAPAYAVVAATLSVRDVNKTVPVNAVA